jgi:hypothetical protein
MTAGPWVTDFGVMLVLGVGGGGANGISWG